jgi:hypothetical protein
MHQEDFDDTMSGTTAIAAFFHKTVFTVANIGDSRAVVGEKKGRRVIAYSLSIDQTPYRQDERERVKACGAVVMSCDQLEGIVPYHENWGVNLGEELDNGGDGLDAADDSAAIKAYVAQSAPQLTVPQVCAPARPPWPLRALRIASEQPDPHTAGADTVQARGSLHGGRAQVGRRALARPGARAHARRVLVSSTRESEESERNG